MPIDPGVCIALDFSKFQFISLEMNTKDSFQVSGYCYYLLLKIL